LNPQIQFVQPQRPMVMPLRRGGPQRRRADRSLGWLGALTPQQAAQIAMPSVSNTAGFTQTVFNDIVQAAQTGNFVGFNPSGCPAGATGSIAGAALTKTASSILITLAGVTTALGPIAAIAAPILGVFSTIFAHHAQAVAQEQAIVCSAVPSAAQALSVIEAAMRNGTIDPGTAIASIQQVQAEFQQTVAPILKMSTSQCNAACVWTKELQAIVAELSSQWQDELNAASAATAAAAQGSPSTPGAASGAVATLSVPPWAWLAAAAALIFLL
jgi:hypothetical protein